MEKSYLILVVEDNEMNREIVVRRLKKNGYTVIQAFDGLEGFEKATQNLPDLILMDINLPIMDGIESTKKIKEHKETSRIPIIALTAHVKEDSRAQIIASGCDDFEPKPVNFDNLFKKIKDLIHSSKLP
ncbi:MAG: response regulator [Oligoflexales bacterium]|nr:response regulator [Oligoflexales bacterium]